jgi:hypothetical protein
MNKNQMKYHGNNPVGLALAADTRGEVRDMLLRVLGDYQAAAEQGTRSSSVLATYQRNLAAAECAAVCAAVVKEFHAVCVSASAEQMG